MKRITIIAAMVAAALSAGAAQADCNGAFVSNCSVDSPSNTTNNQGGTGIGIGVAGASSNAAAIATSVTTQGQLQGQHQGQHQGQLQGQSNSAVGTGNQTAINYNAPPPNLRDLAPGFALGGLYPSSPCMGTSNVGGSGPGFSIGFGTSWVDEECQKMEASRNAPTAADKIHVWCKSKFADGSPSCPKAKAAEATPAVKVVADDRKKKTSEDKPKKAVDDGIMQPVTCVSDAYIARRMGTTVCQ